MKKIQIFLIVLTFIFFSSQKSTAAIVNSYETNIKDFFPKNINGEKGVFAQYRTLAGQYFDLENTADYLFQKPDNSLKIPDALLTGSNLDIIVMHPSAILFDRNEVRTSLLKIILDGGFDSLQFKGSCDMAFPTQGQAHFSIYLGDSGYNNPIWKSDNSQDSFDIKISYKNGDPLYIAVAPWTNTDDLFETCEWHDLIIKGLGKSQPKPTLTVFIPDTTAVIGTIYFPLQLKIANPTQINLPNIDFVCEIAYDATAFLPAPVSYNVCIKQNTIINNERILQLEGKNVNINNKENLLSDIFGTVLLADLDTTPVYIKQFTCSNPNIIFTTHDGSLTVTGCMLQLSRIKFRDLLYMDINPNPASDEFEIKISGDEEGAYKFTLYNLQGYKIDTKILNYNKQSANTFKLNTNGYPNGFYQCILQSPQRYIIKPLMIVK